MNNFRAINIVIISDSKTDSKTYNRTRMNEIAAASLIDSTVDEVTRICAIVRDYTANAQELVNMAYSADNARFESLKADSRDYVKSAAEMLRTARALTSRTNRKAQGWRYLMRAASSLTSIVNSHVERLNDTVAEGRKVFA